MPINLEGLSDVEQEITPDFEGRQPITLKKITVSRLKTGSDGVRFWLEWEGDAGERASTFVNWFNDSKVMRGHQQANSISWNQTIAPIFKAAGMTDGDLPKKTTLDISKAFNAYEGKLRVSGIIGKDDNGYNVASEFRAA